MFTKLSGSACENFDLPNLTGEQVIVTQLERGKKEEMMEEECVKTKVEEIAYTIYER